MSNANVLIEDLQGLLEKIRQTAELALAHIDERENADAWRFLGTILVLTKGPECSIGEVDRALDEACANLHLDRYPKGTCLTESDLLRIAEGPQNERRLKLERELRKLQALRVAINSQHETIARLITN